MCTLEVQVTTIAMKPFFFFLKFVENICKVDKFSVTCLISSYIKFQFYRQFMDHLRSDSHMLTMMKYITGKEYTCQKVESAVVSAV